MAGTIYTVIASEAKQSTCITNGKMDCFVAIAPRNDEIQDCFSRKYGSTGPWTLMVSGLP
jgi:hypothetical protein